MPNLSSLFAIAFFLAAFICEGSAQSATSSRDPGQWALIYSDNLEKNRKSLSNYSWQFEVSVTEGEELLYVSNLEATRAPDGKLETVRIRKKLKIKERRGILSRAGQEKRFAEIEEKIEFIKGVILSYVYMSRGEMVDFFDKAKVTEAVGYTNALKVAGESVLRDGDDIVLYGDRGSAHPLFLTFSVPFDEQLGVSGSIEFQSLRNTDIFYGAEIKANFIEIKKMGKAKNLRIEIESFDFQKK